MVVEAVTSGESSLTFSGVCHNCFGLFSSKCGGLSVCVSDFRSVTWFLIFSRWHWIAFLTGASTAAYVYLYATYYFFTKTKMSGFFQVSSGHPSILDQVFVPSSVRQCSLACVNCDDFTVLCCILATVVTLVDFVLLWVYPHVLRRYSHRLRYTKVLLLHHTDALIRFSWVYWSVGVRTTHLPICKDWLARQY